MFSKHLLYFKLLFLPNVSSSSSQARVAEVIAHEVAHMWYEYLLLLSIMNMIIII